jgi:hypothetical protein
LAATLAIHSRVGTAAPGCPASISSPVFGIATAVA